MRGCGESLAILAYWAISAWFPFCIESERRHAKRGLAQKRYEAQAQPRSFQFPVLKAQALRTVKTSTCVVTRISYFCQ